MSRFLSPSLAGLAPYTPGEQPRDAQYIKLNTNESPYPPSPRVAEAITTAEVEDLRLYSDPQLTGLVNAIARRNGLSADMVMAGNGSDEILSMAVQAFCLDGGLRFPDITYGFYKVWAALYRVKDRQIPLKEDFTIDPADYYNAGETVVLANPNAPTGIALTLPQIEDILCHNPNNVVIIDEAYVDFGGQSCLPLLAHYDNLLIVQTFSKSRSLAGARLGFAMGAPALIADLNRVRFSFHPYNINRLSLLAGAAAMEDERYFAGCIAAVVSTRQRVAAALTELQCKVLPSRANFLFVCCPGLPGGVYCKKLRDRGVLVRHFTDSRIEDFVRVSIGSDAQMDAYLAATADIIKEASL